MQLLNYKLCQSTNILWYETNESCIESNHHLKSYCLVLSTDLDYLWYSSIRLSLSYMYMLSWMDSVKDWNHYFEVSSSDEKH